MKLSFSMPNMVQARAMVQDWERGVTGADQTRLAKLADDLGFAMICVPEHHVIPNQHVPLSGSHYFASYPGMAYFAGATSRIKVNSCITILPLQNPIVSAKALTTIDWMSSGRCMVTFAAGWLKEEFDLLGVDFHQRGKMCDEYLAAIIELWTSSDPQFEGKYVSFRDVAFEPRPVQKPHPPVWIGGDAEAVLRRTARHAQGWWPFLTMREDIPARIDFIKSQPDYNGQLRDVFYGLSTGRIGDGHVVTGDAWGGPNMPMQAMIDKLGELAALGVTMSGVAVPTVGSIAEFEDYARWLAGEVIPAIADF